jgi:carboxyl-terminal processing protease
MQGLLKTSGQTLAAVGLPTATLSPDYPGSTAGAEQIPFSALRGFTQLYAAIKARDPALDDMQLFEGAIRAMVAGLDGRSDYLDAEQLQELKTLPPGIGGIGVEVSKEGSVIRVVAAIEDTPAARVGLTAGETLTAIDGQPVAALSLSEVARRLRGPVGSTVVLVVTDVHGRNIQTRVRRERITLKGVTSRLAGAHIAYVRIAAFRAGTGRDLGDQLTQLEQATRLDGVILDLRNNPGGVLNDAVAVADAFLAQGTIVTLHGRNESAPLRFSATPDRQHPRRETLPLVVLVNGGTASGAEIVTAALQDHHRAHVIGSGTYGLATVATLFPLPNGGALKLTTSRYLRPTETALHGQGITPDTCFAHDTPPTARQPPTPCAQDARPAPPGEPDRELAYALQRLAPATASER